MGGSVVPSSPPCQPSSRCGSPSSSTTSPDPRSSTESASKKLVQRIRKYESISSAPLVFPRDTIFTCNSTRVFNINLLISRIFFSLYLFYHLAPPVDIYYFS